MNCASADERVVRPRNFGETAQEFGAARHVRVRVTIGVRLLGEATKGLLDVGARRLRVEAEDAQSCVRVRRSAR